VIQKLKQILLLALVVISCKSIQHKPVAEKSESIIFEMHRGGCYGTCPIYNISLYKNGRIEYVGHRFTKNIGLYKWRIKQADFKTIEAILSKTFNTSSTYKLALQDLPQTTLTVKNKHQIKFKGACPNAFRKELKTIEDILMKNSDWNATKKSVKAQ
jgi:hypothetical protein